MKEIKETRKAWDLSCRYEKSKEDSLHGKKGERKKKTNNEGLFYNVVFIPVLKIRM